MTFSIVGLDTVTGELGVAISTRTVAVGAMCIRARAGVGAVATQAWTNPLLSVDTLDALESSPEAAEAMQQALAADPCSLWLFDYHHDDGDTGVALHARLARRFGARPALILSADDSVEVRRDVLEDGLSLLSKPVRPLALKSVLDRMLAAQA